MSTAFRSALPARQPPSIQRSPLYPVPAKHSPNQPTLSKPRPVHSVPKGSRPPLRAIASPTSGVATLKRFPTKWAMPLWLRLLLQVQRGSLVVAFVLVTATLIVYGSTVHMQQLWSKAHSKLKTQMRNELEMMATNEGLKNQLALQAVRPGSGLVPQTPGSTIVLQPARQRRAFSPSPSVPKAEAVPNNPLGY